MDNAIIIIVLVIVILILCTKRENYSSYKNTLHFNNHSGKNVSVKITNTKKEILVPTFKLSPGESTIRKTSGKGTETIYVAYTFDNRKWTRFIGVNGGKYFIDHPKGLSWFPW